MEIRGVDRAFSPQVIGKQRIKGVNHEVRHDLLPGYVFLFHHEKLTDYRLFSDIDGVIRRVGRKEDGYEMEGPDLDFAMKLLKKDGLVGRMRIRRVGDGVALEDPLFSQCRGRVTKVDFRKERAKVEFVFDRNGFFSWVSLDDLKNMPKPEGEA